MDCLQDFLNSSARIRIGDSSIYEIPVQWVLSGLATLLAFVWGYRSILRSREAPIAYNVPLPPEVRADWQARAWDDLRGEERSILEAQVQGVSSLLFSPPFNPNNSMLFLGSI